MTPGMVALITWLEGLVVARVAFEPTGAYHHGFERRLAAAGLPLCKVNPRQACRFAEAIGCHAKTDAVDAAMLARFAALIEPPTVPVASAALDEMKELHVARRALVKDPTAAATAATCAARCCSDVRWQSASGRSSARSTPSTPPSGRTSQPILP